MLWLLLGVPAGGALLAFALPWNLLRRMLLVAVAGAHLGLTAASFLQPPGPVLNGWIALDAAAQLFLAITSVVFFMAALYAVGYLAHETVRGNEDPREEVPFVNFPEAVFTGCLLMFLAVMTLVIVSHHWGLMWIAVEATTLASAPLIYFHRHARSLEATWKYLVICSVGIALALLGNFFLAVAAKACQVPSLHLTLANLEQVARQLDPRWLKAAYMLLLVGYGTKMGLAPMHTWLPDAHSEAPSMVSALLSGALLNCAFLAILRGHSLLVKAGEGEFSRDLLVLFGLGSMTVAAVFVIRQMDFKRLLAYSSVEHMGILALGVGIGGVAGFGSMLHAVNHSLTKALLFLVAGNTLACFHTKSALEVHGVRRVLPVTGCLWMIGTLAIVGSPPFGPFLSELAVLKGLLDTHHLWAAVWYLVALAVVFVAMSAVVIPLVYGEPASADQVPRLQPPATSGWRWAGEAWWSVLPPVLLGLAVLVLGVYVPPAFCDFLHDAARSVGAE